VIFVNFLGKDVNHFVRRLLISVIDCIMDITQGKQTDSPGIVSNERFSDTLDHIMESVQIIGFDWRYKYINASGAKQNRFAKEELLGFTMMEKYPGIENTELFKCLENCMTERVQHLMETEFAFSDNSTGWFEISMQPVPEGVFILSVDITKRKATQQQLQESELFNKGILASLNMQIAVINENGFIVAVNPAWDNFAKENGATLLDRVSKGANYFDVCKKSIDAGEVLAGRALKGIQSVFNKEVDIFELEYPRHSPDKQRWFIFNAMSFGIKEPIVVISHQEITNRKIAEYGTKTSETKYRRLFESAKDGILILNGITGKIIDANPFVIDLLEYNYDQLLGKELWEIGFFADAEASKNAFRVLQEDEYIRYEDLPLETLNGQKINVEFVSNVYLVNNEKVIQCNIRDITDRIKTEESLRVSQSNLKAITENTDANIYSLDRDLCYVAFNQRLKNAMKNLYGMNIKVGDSVLDFLKKYAPEEIENWKSIYDNAFKGEAMTLEKEYNLGGFHNFTKFSIYPIWENTTVIGLSCFAVDITQQKDNELEKAKMAADLMRHNKDLQQFAFIISHNLRAPVANIIGLSEELKDNAHSIEEKDTFIKMLSSSVSKFDGVIKDMSRILQIGKDITEAKELVTFSNLVADIKESIGTLLVKENIQIVTNFSAVNELVCLKSYLYSAFFNLISNSIKYRRPQIDAAITIKSEKLGNNIILSFKDNGMGIDLEHKKDQVFVLYKRFHRNIEGQGMGLYMTKKQIGILGGTIDVKSEVNMGAEFIITLPVNT
jgi:PAS domain S-box-containing protein